MSYAKLIVSWRRIQRVSINSIYVLETEFGIKTNCLLNICAIKTMIERLHFTGLMKKNEKDDVNLHRAKRLKSRK